MKRTCRSCPDMSTRRTPETKILKHVLFRLLTLLADGFPVRLAAKLRHVRIWEHGWLVCHDATHAHTHTHTHTRTQWPRMVSLWVRGTSTICMPKHACDCECTHVHGKGHRGNDPGLPSQTNRSHHDQWRMASVQQTRRA